MNATLKSLVLMTTIALGVGTIDALSRLHAHSAIEAPVATLTFEELGRILTGLGFEPEPFETPGTGVRGYSISFARGDWQIVMNVTLSQDRAVIWLFAPLSRLADIDQIRPAALLALLGRNGTMGLAYFSYDPDSGMLYLDLPVPVSSLSPSVFRSRIEALADLIKSTVDVWDVRGWRESDAALSRAEATRRTTL